MLRLIDRYLDPSESLLEILFGLIMALTMTAGARLLSDPDEIRRLDLALGLLGCNVAWGLIDAVFYLLGSQFNRNRRVRFTHRVQGAANDEEAIGLVREEFGLEGQPQASQADREALHRSLLAFFRGATAERKHFSRDELISALIIFVLVTCTALPGLLPLMAVPGTNLALRLANGLQVALLLVVGYRWARYTGTPGWRGAMIVGTLGVTLVLVAVALGG